MTTLKISALALVLLLPANQSPKDLLAAGRADDARQLLQQLIIASPADAEAYNFLCRVHFSLNEWDAAITACEKAVSLDSEKSLYHLWLGRAYGEKADKSSFLTGAGLAKKVRTEFERAVQIDPASLAARTDLAEFYLEAPGIVGGGKDKARLQAEAIARLNPSSAHWVTGRIAEKNKDNVGAEHEYRAAIEASHSGAHAWLNLALFYRHASRFDEMEQALQKMQSEPLDRPESLTDGASILFRTGRDPSLAIQLVRRYLSSATVEEEPAFNAHYLLCELLEKQGNRAAAAEECRAALALAHTFAPARDALERLDR
jgi:tetratricopeptide (TPR) repeat protein